MPMITHFNFRNSSNEIYCCLRNRVVLLDSKQSEQFCKSCKMYEGDCGGRGVACAWEDARNINNPHLVTNPHAEFSSNQIRQVRLKGPSMLVFTS
ncbi:hypothetical protein J2Z66_002494 [Paenibacillus eucommiae]|uniref:Uncharacterized protein n=1 Tax=Paenibacillus eucommiae TaxID=1355755 RepID=A0ABS4ITK8_9BACL|nr:hypothetical protein [Paenibacillus eucommiae]